jgi:histidine ammonia-lyase
VLLAVLHVNDRPEGYYRYKGTAKPDQAAVQAENTRKLLRDNKQRISFNATSVRALSIRLNQQIAQALCDGIKVTRLAAAADLSRWAVRTVGLSADDLVPSGTPAEEHLARIRQLKSELAEFEESRTMLEDHRLNLLAAARRRGVLDDYELAALSGLQRETIRKMTWGVQPEAGAIPA